MSNQNAIPDKPKFQSQWMNNIIVNDIKSNIRNFHNIEIMNGGPQEIVEINQGSNLKSILTTSNFNNLLPEYVIITNNYDINGNLIPSYNNKNMVQTFQELADWKTKKGVPTVVVTVDEIKENYQGCDVQEKIHNFLNDLYYNYTGSIFILFGGDVNIIPERYANINFHGIPEPSDLYYCGIETNWNTNNNAAFGEDGIDNVDFSSEFYYGRAPVENVIETSIFVNKIFKYEKFPIEVVNIQYVKKGIIAMWENVQCSEIESIMNSLPVSDLTLDRMLGLGKCNSMILSRINFLNALNNGQYHFVYHLDHANYLTLGTSPTLNENVNRTDFNNLSNSPYYSILFTSGCLSSEIQKDCITERFVNAPFGGGVAAIGNSTEGYSDELWMFNNFIQTLFGSGNNGFGFYNLGIVFDKCILPTGLNNFRKKRLLLLGDPEMQIWSKTPIHLSVTTTPAITNVNNQLTINVSNILYNDSVVVCVMKENEVYLRQKGIGYQNNKTFTFLINPETAGNLKITVSGHNYIPFETTVPVTITNRNIIIENKVIQDANNGNNNNKLDAGETVNLAISLKNNGIVVANGVTASLICNVYNQNYNINSILTFSNQNATYGNLNPNCSIVNNTFSFLIDKDTPDGTLLLFTLTINDINGYSIVRHFSYQVQASDLVYIQNSRSINGNTSSIFLELFNNGTGNSLNLMGTLTSQSNLVISTNNVSFGNISTFETKRNIIPFEIQNYNGEPLILTVVDQYGKTKIFNFEIMQPFLFVENLKFTSTQNTITLTWDPVENISGYNVYRSLQYGSAYTKINNMPFNASTYTDVGLNALTKYYYRVTLIDQNGNESDFTPITTTTIYPMHEGWPIILDDIFGTHNNSAPIAKDVDNDEKLELFITQTNYTVSNIGGVYAFNHLGEELFNIDNDQTTISGFAGFNSRVKSFPAIGDIDGDGIDEIAISTIHATDNNSDQKKTFVYKTTQDLNNDGKPDYMWETFTGECEHGPIMAPFKNQSNTLELFSTPWSNNEYSNLSILNNNGTIYQNISIEAPAGTYDGISSNAACDDIDNDGEVDIVVGYSSGLYLYSKNQQGVYAEKWKYENSNYTYMNSPVVLADLDGDGDLEIIFVMMKDYSGLVCAKHHNNVFVNNWTPTDNIHLISLNEFMDAYGINYAVPYLSVGDLTKDGIPEIIIGGSNYLYVWNSTGAPLNNFPKYITDLNMEGNAPIIADIDGNNDVEIILSSNNNYVYAYHANGSNVMGFPLNMAARTPCVADIDNDGKNELVLVSDLKISVFDTEGDSRLIEWGQIRFNEKNCGSYKKECLNTNQGVSLVNSANWTSFKRITHDISIPNNVELTISNEVQFSSDAKLIVQKGGTLILNGAKLTNLCLNKPWQGIIVEGTSTQSQMGNNPNQGIVYLNNAIIENAICGIKVGDQSDISKSGGIVYATNTTFKNCKNAVLFAPYQNINNNNVEFANRSKFTECNFIVNNDFYTSGMFFDSHAKLLGVNGISFTGCSFTNTQTNLNPSARSYASSGISAINSGFSVQPKCFSNVASGEVCAIPYVDVHSVFSGLDYGIVIQDAGTMNQVKISSTQFSNNYFGVYVSGLDNVKLLNNDFAVGKSSPNFISNPCGVYFKYASNFRIEENRFSKYSNFQGLPFGLQIKSSGIDNNVVYKNKFFELEIAQNFVGANYWMPLPHEGLKSVCNEHESINKYDIYVTKDPGSRVNGINIYQNMTYTLNGIDQTGTAGNKFTPSQTVDLQYNNDANYLYYYYNQNNPFEILNDYSTTTINCEIAPENPCFSKLFGLYPSTINAQLSNISYNYGNLKYNYNQLIDAGNTEDLLDLIQDEWSDDIWKLRTELLSKSPYLSQEALYNVALKNLLPPALFLEICLANPDATKSEEFLEKLRTVIPNPLPEYMINLIRASWNVKTLRTDLEEELSAFKTYRDEYQNYKTEILLSDTIYNYTDIINHLESRGSYSDYLSLAEIALSQDNFEQANLYLDIFENNNGKLSEEIAAEIASFRDYISIRETIFLDSTNIYNLDSIQITTLETYASSNNYRGAILARNILCFLYNICIDDVPAPPKMLRIGTNANTSKNTTPYIASVKVLPNPANSYVSFIWDMKSYDQPAILYIYDQTGKTVMTKEIENTQGQWIWDLKNTPSGVYVYTLKSDQLILYSGKVIVNK